MTTTTTRRDIDLPLYASKPKRKVDAGCTAITMYRSTDGSVRDYAIADTDGKIVGRVTYQPARIGRTRGYVVPSGDHRPQWFPNLDAAARHFTA